MSWNDPKRDEVYLADARISARRPSYAPGPMQVRQHPSKGHDGRLLDRIAGTKGIVEIPWNHIPWRVALSDDGSILFVLSDDANAVRTHAVALQQLSEAIQACGGDPKELKDKLMKGQPLPMTPAGSALQRTQMSRASTVVDRKIALETVTDVVKAALAAGASFQDIRVAVYGALGLDDDPATM